MKQTKQGRGFTLLELLIVIAIIAILSVILVLVLNPAETLKKSRDAQRISDLSTVKTALGLYMTATSSPFLGSATANTACANTLFYSQTGPSGTVGSLTKQGTASTTVDGLGWIPVNLDSLTGGSPLSNFPLDPSNTVAGTGSSTDLVYRYACKASPLSFELNATLESAAYTSEDNKLTKDGGNNLALYEVGTDLTILPSTSDF